MDEEKLLMFLDDEAEEPNDVVSPRAKGKRRGLLGRLFKREKHAGIGDPVPEITVNVANDILQAAEDIVHLPPVVESSRSSNNGQPFMAVASVPLALVVCMLFLRAAWYFVQHHKKVAAEGTATTTATAQASGRSISNATSSTSKGSTIGKAEGTTTKPALSKEDEERLQVTVEREATAKQSLATENKALQDALQMHKSSVDKFNMELQARNERLSVFEQEQETVRKQLSSQIEVLKQELQERQKQEQGNLNSKETLCNDLITKIKALNKDLENHEKLWQGVAKKAEQKEAESAVKVDTLKNTMQAEEQQRVSVVQTKEKAFEDLTKKLKILQAQHAQRKAQVAACEQQMGSGVFPVADEKLQAQLKTEQDYAQSLTTKLQVFSAELKSREERVSNLDAKMKEVERLSASELKKLQQELEGQGVQREKLQQAAVEMTRLLQEKQNQCARLKTQWESSKAELQSIDERVKTLTNEVSKREAMAMERIDAMQGQLDQERQQHRTCQQTSEATNEELIKKQEEFVQLTTRMGLFLKELQFRDEQVASLESKLHIQEDLATSDIKALQSHLQELTERRDTWNKSTDEVNQLMKDKKAQVVGLTTRADLFELELKSRQDGVELLKGKIKERQEAEAVKMEPYRKQLLRLEEDRDSWQEKTEEIGCLLRQKLAESEGLTTRLKLFRVELSKRDAHVSTLKTTCEDKKHLAQMDMAPVREKLEQLRQQFDSWRTKTDDIDETLEQKRGECVGLKTRVHLFGRELEAKERTVSELEAMVADKEETGDSVVAYLKSRRDEHVKGRDEWKVSTEKVTRLLAERKTDAADLTSDLKSLVGDLQGYQQRQAKLSSRLVQQRRLYEGRRAAMQEDLAAANSHRDAWAEKTLEVIQALKATEQSIPGIETRVFLFDKELAQREEAVNKLRQEYSPMERKSSNRIEQLRGAINAEKNLHDHGLETTVKLNKELKDAKRECIGLTTRSQLFAREVTKWQEALSEQEEKIHHLESEASASLERLRRALPAQEKHRDEWAEKTQEVDKLQADNAERIVGLSTRLELFMVEVMKEEENVARAMNQRASNREIDGAKAKRDEWTARALDIEKELKERKAQAPGLTTRKSLFGVELAKRNDQVSELKSKIYDKEKLTSAVVAPLKEKLNGIVQQRDQWATNAAGLNEKLNERQRQCLPISTRLEEVIDQLTLCKERGSKLTEQLRDEEGFYKSEVMRLKLRLEQQKKELSDWRKNTANVRQLLREQKQGIEGLRTRLHVFRDELRKRANAADGISSKIEANVEALTNELRMINAQIEAEHRERDRIIATTMAKNQALKAMEDTCVAMSVRRKLFEGELRNREEQASLLESKYPEKEHDHRVEMKRLKNLLTAKRSDRDKWRDSTKSLEKLLQDTEQECVGLATRSHLFHVETTKYENQVADLEGAVARKETNSAESMASLQNKLRQEQQKRDAWDKKTVELDDQLQDNRREVVGLNTRSKLFVRELKMKEEGVAALSAKIDEHEEDFAERIKPLVQEYNTLQGDRDKWAKSTADVKSMLERTEAECASIPTRLDLFRREQETRASAVAELEASISNKEDLVAVQMGFLLNELQLQQKQRGKWKKVTLEMHRLLKETKEQVAMLTEKLESSNSQMQKHQEKVTSLTVALRDGRDMVAQQLNTLRREVERQAGKRDKLRESTAELKDLLEKAQEQTKELTEKLTKSEARVQDCTAAVASLEAKVTEKKALDASQIESFKAQLKIHLGQRAEWRENTNQMQQKLKEKQQLCTGLKTKIFLLKNLQNGNDVRSCLSTDEGNAAAGDAAGGVATHLDKINKMTMGLGKKSDAEVNLTARMDSLENELRKQQEDEKQLVGSTQQLEQGLVEKESQSADLAGRLTTMQNQYGSSEVDVDRMLAEKEKKQSNLTSRLESLTGELLNL